MITVKHREAENSIIHDRNFSDALQIAREIEFDIWYVVKTLGATKEQYARKSHVYVFPDDNSGGYSKMLGFELLK